MRSRSRGTGVRGAQRRDVAGSRENSSKNCLISGVHIHIL